jgi:hypothetical protein
MAPAKPLQLIWSAVNRFTVEGPVMGPDQVLDLDASLRAMTIEAAFSIRLENEVGSVVPGKFANFTVLEQSPYEVATSALKDIPVWGTILEGRVQPAPAAVTGRRAQAGAAPRLALNPAAAGPAHLHADCCPHLLRSGPDAEPTLGCACGGGAFSAIISAMLDTAAAA